MDKRLQCFAVETLITEMVDINHSPWIYENTAVFPRCTWETILIVYEDEFNQSSNMLDEYSKLLFNQKIIVNEELISLSENLLLLSKDINNVFHKKSIRHRISKSLDYNYDISEYSDISKIVGSMLFYVTQHHKEKLSSWIE